MKEKHVVHWPRVLAQPATFLGIVAIVIIVGGAYFFAAQEYKRAGDEWVHRGANVARIFDDNIGSIVRNIDGQLILLRQLFQRNAKDFNLAEWAEAANLNRDLAIHFTLVGADHTILATSLSLNPPTAYVGDRAPFLRHANSTRDQLDVNAPVIDGQDKEPTIQFTRRLFRPDGSFGGVVIASLGLQSLQNYISASDFGEHSTISLVGFDGIVRLRTDNEVAAADMGRNLSKSTLFEYYRQSPRGHYWTHETFDRSRDGARSLISYRAMDAAPFIVVVENADTEIFKRAHDSTRIGWSKAFFFTGIILLAIGIAATRERKLIVATQELTYRARHDVLTGLANRQAFVDEIDKAVSQFNANGENFSVVILDLDRFKSVNDLFGHLVGDALLQDMAFRLKSSLHDTEFLARLGGDEFAIIQRHERHIKSADATVIAQRETAIALAQRILSCFKKPFVIEGKTLNVGTSIGIALAEQGTADSNELMKGADLALYCAKIQGRGSYIIFDRTMIAEIDSRQRIDNELREALSSNELIPYYQPIIDVQTSKVSCVEALVRWRHPLKGIVAAHEFISIAEATDLIVPLDRWILQNACMDAASWPAHIKVVVNLSTAYFRECNVISEIGHALFKSGLPAERLEIDITEATATDRDGQNLHTLHELKKLGISIVLDDFGTGHSTLNILTAFPFDKIKIDGSLTVNLTKNSKCSAVIATVVVLGRYLNILTAGTGVESVDEFMSLRALGINFVQGYLFGRPCPTSELHLDDFYYHQLQVSGDHRTAAH